MAKKAASKKNKKKSVGPIRKFWKETIGELRKVSWPSRREAVNLTGIVIVVMILMAAFLGGLDYAFLQFFTWLFS